MTRILVEENPSPLKLEVLGVEDWDTIERRVSIYSCSYDQTETCYIVDGEAVVITSDGETVCVSTGDLVVLMAGLSCVWDVRRPLRAHFRIG